MGGYVIYFLIGEKVLIYIVNYVLVDYGIGVVMGVLVYDQRDFEFVKKYNFFIKVVIKGEGVDIENFQSVYEDEGVLINFGIFDGFKNIDVMKKIIQYLE